MDTMVLDMIDTDCPSCGAADGEPCRRGCDDGWGGVVKAKHKRPHWDDEY